LNRIKVTFPKDPTYFSNTSIKIGEETLSVRSMSIDVANGEEVLTLRFSLHYVDFEVEEE